MTRPRASPRSTAAAARRGARVAASRARRARGARAGDVLGLRRARSAVCAACRRCARARRPRPVERDGACAAWAALEYDGVVAAGDPRVQGRRPHGCRGAARAGPGGGGRARARRPRPHGRPVEVCTDPVDARRAPRARATRPSTLLLARCGIRSSPRAAPRRERASTRRGSASEARRANAEGAPRAPARPSPGAGSCSSTTCSRRVRRSPRRARALRRRRVPCDGRRGARRDAAAAVRGHRQTPRQTSP